jgi:hypothetical protein
MEKLAGTRTLSWRAGLGGGIENRNHSAFEIRVRSRQVGERLERVSFDDDASVVEVFEEDVGRQGAFGESEFEAWKEQREVPANFLLEAWRGGAGGEREEFFPEWAEKVGALQGDFFDGVGGAHADHRIMMGDASNEMREGFWILQDFGDELIGTAQGTFRPTRKFFEN